MTLDRIFGRLSAVLRRLEKDRPRRILNIIVDPVARILTDDDASLARYSTILHRGILIRMPIILLLLFLLLLLLVFFLFSLLFLLLLLLLLVLLL